MLKVSSSPGHRNAQKRVSLEEWEIDQSSVSQGRKIGSGSFGTVFKGEYFGMLNERCLHN